MVLETDASKEGWGAVLYAKPKKDSSKSEEEIIGYASGKYDDRVTWTGIDWEIEAMSEALNKFRLYLNKDFTIRSDSKVIVDALNNDATKKKSRVRWLKLIDLLLVEGYKATFEYIKGSNNFLANLLSRFVQVAHAKVAARLTDDGWDCREKELRQPLQAPLG
jgi:ribonuclease HI